MKRAILTSMVLVLMLFLLPSCTVWVSAEEYDRVSSNLVAAQTQIESLQADLTEAEAQIQSLRDDLTKAHAQIQSLQSDREFAEGKRAEALAYAEYVDILLYPAWMEAGVAYRFMFEDEVEWLVELKNRATDMGDTKLSNYIKQLEKGNEAAMNWLWDHCLDKLEEALK